MLLSTLGMYISAYLSHSETQEFWGCITTCVSTSPCSWKVRWWPPKPLFKFLLGRNTHHLMLKIHWRHQLTWPYLISRRRESAILPCAQKRQKPGKVGEQPHRLLHQPDMERRLETLLDGIATVISRQPRIGNWYKQLSSWGRTWLSQSIVKFKTIFMFLLSFAR